MRRELTQEEDDFLCAECKSFKPGTTFEAYLADIRRYLILCPWHFEPEHADERISWNMNPIRESYEKQEPVADIALDIGYTCG